MMGAAAVGDVLDELGADLDGALALLNDLVASGVEYPDAQWRAIHKFGLTPGEGDELQQLYDQQC